MTKTLNSLQSSRIKLEFSPGYDPIASHQGLECINIDLFLCAL
jgi:hypothetical protein